jgi:hypothetical protein
MKKLALLALISLLPLHSIAATEEGIYFGLGYGKGIYSEDRLDGDPIAFLVRFGTYIGDNFSIEGRLGTGVGDDTVQVDGEEVVGESIEVGTVTGVYGLRHLKLDKQASIYGAIGFSRVELTLTSPIRSVTDDTSLSLGVGIQIDQLNIEFMQYLNQSNFEFSAIGIGVLF